MYHLCGGPCGKCAETWNEDLRLPQILISMLHVSCPAAMLDDKFSWGVGNSHIRGLVLERERLQKEAAMGVAAEEQPERAQEDEVEADHRRRPRETARGSLQGLWFRGPAWGGPSGPRPRGVAPTFG
jgi:hypothetical protein